MASRNAIIVSQYERAFGRVVNRPYAYSFWKGRVALFAILRALGIGHGDEVILPGFTCVVVPNSVRMCGATPIYADIREGTYNLDPVSVERSITSRTRALIIQHTFGIPADMDSLLDVACRHKLAIVEDCAHALGSTFRGQQVGTFGVGAFYSSQWSKPYTTGLGGMAVTADSEMAARVRVIQEEFAWPALLDRSKLRLQYHLYRRFFSPKAYWTALDLLHRLSRWGLFVGSSDESELMGGVPHDGKWRMSEFQASIGLKQLPRLSHQLEHRRRLAEIYEDYLRGEGWQLAQVLRDSDVQFLRYPLRVANKQELLHCAERERVEIGSWMETVLHPVKGSILDSFGYKAGQCPMAEQAAQEVVNLPMHPSVSFDEAHRIAAFICRVAQNPP